RLRRWTLSITISYQHKSGRLCLFDECDGRAFGIDLRIVIDGRAEERNHPFIDLIFPVIALEIGNACAGHSRSKALCLGDSPHGHVSAITPAGNAQAVLVDGSFFQHLINTGKNVTKISVAKIFYVRTSKGLTLAKTAARIRHENKVSNCGERYAEVGRPRP